MSEAIPHDPVLQQFPEVEWDEEFGTLIVPATKATEVAIWLRDDHAFRLDYCSNVTGIDYLDREFKEKVKNEEARRRRSFTRTPPEWKSLTIFTRWKNAPARS